MAAPHQAIAQEGSFFATSTKSFASAANECSFATAMRNSACTERAQEFSNSMVPNVAGSPAPICAWSACTGEKAHAMTAAIERSTAVSVLARTILAGLHHLMVAKGIPICRNYPKLAIVVIRPDERSVLAWTGEKLAGPAGDPVGD